MGFNLLLSGGIHPDGLEILQAAQDIDVCGPFLDRSSLFATLVEADALLVQTGLFVDSELLDMAPRLKVIGRLGAQIDMVDLDEAPRRGILVVRSPDASVHSVAEHVFALLFALARHIPEAAALARAGNWDGGRLLGFELYGKTLGLVGFGRLGRAVAGRAQAFGMKVLAYDPFIDLAFAHTRGVEVVNFYELLERADIVSLHTVHTVQTHAMMNNGAFRRLKAGAYFINCAHPGLVDEEALLTTLETNWLAGAALDTFEHEPPPADYPLLRHPRLLATPNMRQSTHEAQSLTARQVVEDVLAALRGEDYRHVVNLPFDDSLTYQVARPYFNLARKLGKLQGQLAQGWIKRVEVELLGEGLHDLMRPVAAVLLSGMLRPIEGRIPNWVSAPVLAYEQGIVTAQAKGLVPLADYPNLIACRIFWEGGQRTVAGVLFGNGEARLVQYDEFRVDAYPDGYVLILENDDVPGVIGKVGTRLGKARINIAQWRYGRETRGGKAVSFINLDDNVPPDLLQALEEEAEIRSARLVHL